MRSPWKPLPKHDFGAHFLTAKTFENTPYFRNSTCARIFCEELEAARATYGFHILAFVVMPDHIHLLLWWDTGVVISKIAWAVKGRAARRIVAHLKGLVDVNSRVADGNAVGHPQGHPEDEGRVGGGIAFIHPAPILRPVRKALDKPHYRNWQYKIWQQGSGYDFNVYTEHKLLEKIAYIHANPVRAGLAATPEAYFWSSARTYAGLPAAPPVQITLCTEVL